MSANGVDLCLEEFGERDRPAILLIHGAGNCMLSWDDEFCARLAAESRLVIRYDGRDAGRSVSYEPGAPPYGGADLVADAVGVLDALDLERAHVLGLSAGAGIGQLLALDHPDRIASLTLACSTPGDAAREGSDLPGVSAELREFFAAEPPEPNWADRPAVIDYLVEAERPFAARSRPFDEPAMRRLAARIVDHTVNVASMVTNPYLVEGPDPWRERLGEVRAPTLVLHGREDPLFPYEHGVALASEIPNTRLLAVESMGHEYFPRSLWDVVVPAIAAHTARA